MKNIKKIRIDNCAERMELMVPWRKANKNSAIVGSVTRWFFPGRRQFGVPSQPILGPVDVWITNLGGSGLPSDKGRGVIFVLHVESSAPKLPGVPERPVSVIVTLICLDDFEGTDVTIKATDRFIITDARTVKPVP